MANPVDGRIVQVQRKLRMSATEPLPPKEFSLSVGTRDGIKVGDVLQVYRSVPVTETTFGQPYGMLDAMIGEVRVHVAGEHVSLARAQRESSNFQLGDQIKTGLPFR